MKRLDLTDSQLETLGFILAKVKDSLEYDEEYESYFTKEQNELTCLDIDSYMDLCEIMAEINTTIK